MVGGCLLAACDAAQSIYHLRPDQDRPARRTLAPQASRSQDPAQRRQPFDSIRPILAAPWTQDTRRRAPATAALPRCTNASITHSHLAMGGRYTACCRRYTACRHAQAIYPETPQVSILFKRNDLVALFPYQNNLINQETLRHASKLVEPRLGSLAT